jgi:GDP-4-dehydro-6-deoxy-D-mannose reductase
MKVLVTGGAGFVGAHLIHVLAARGHAHDITSVSRGGEAPARFHLELPDEGRCLEVIRESQPDAIVHLAAVSFVPAAESSPRDAFAVNATGTQGLMHALNRHDPAGRVRLVFASTAQVYGTGPDAGDREISYSEDSPVRPQNVYARTKLAAELAIEVLGSAPRRPVVIFRPFNHIGPGQRDSFAVSSFARQVARIERGRSPPVLEAGNLAATRDLCDVRDIAEGYALASEGAVPPGTYNLAAEAAVPLEAVVELLRRHSKAPFEVRVREDRLRGAEAASIRGNAGKIRAACGWRSKIPLEVSVLDALNWWRERSDV